MDPLKRKYVSVAQAARLLCLTTVTIRNLIDDGRLEAEKLSGVWVVSLESVDVEFARRYPEFVRKEGR